MFALFLFTFKGNIQCAKKVLRLAMEYADGDKCKIVYSLPEAMVEFSGEKKLKLGLSARQKPICKIYIERSRYFFIRRKQVMLNSRYAKNVIRYSFFRIFAEGQESHFSQTNRVFLKRGLQPHRGSCFLMNYLLLGALRLEMRPTVPLGNKRTLHTKSIRAYAYDNTRIHVLQYAYTRIPMCVYVFLCYSPLTVSFVKYCWTKQ